MTTVPAPGKKPSPLLITLIAVGGVLLLTVVALLALLLGRGLNAQPTADATPTPTPSATTTPSPTPPGEAAPPPPAEDSTPRFTSFTAVTQVECPNSGDKPEIQFNWATANATQVWYTSGHEDAVDDNYMQVPLAGSQADLTDEHLFPCAHRQTADYTLTLVGTDGSRVNQFWTIVDLNWGQGGDDE
jgi:flagellar basal body-associated protein FliL